MNDQEFEDELARLHRAETPAERQAWDAWVASKPGPEELTRFMNSLKFYPEETRGDD